MARRAQLPRLGWVGGALYDVVTLARCGILTPGSPIRMARQVLSLTTWGLGLAGELRQAAVRSPSTVAVVDEAQGEVTYAELYDRSLRVAAVLHSHGLRPGSRIGLLARNHVGAVEVMAAASALGVDLVLLNTGLSGPQLEHVVADQGLADVVYDSEFAGVVEGLPAGLSRETSEDLAAAALASSTPREPTVPERPGRTIILTSGTTGVPKGATRRTPRGLSPLTTVVGRIPFRVKDRILVIAPIFHTWGFGALQVALAMRSTVILQRRFDAKAARDALDRYQPQVVFAIPVMLQRMMELPGDPSERARRALRVVATSGSAFPSGFTTRFMDAYGDVLYNLYGSTEASWVCIATPADLRRHPDTAGTPPHGTRVAILGPDGRPVPEGAVGRIFAGNELVFEGYTSGESKEFVEGMVSTGDLGHFSDGLYFVDGRADDMVVSGGENVYPGEVESTLMAHPAVREVAVVGVPDPEFGQRLAAYIVLASGAALTADDVRQHVRDTLARHAVPRDVVFVEELPRNITGKVLNRHLRENHGQHRGKRSHGAHPDA
ncbi:MAG TPA: AMP-binding protein [Dermatophilaceae bacterium]|nr:AMP-binding protein [Dermatophilaceae bacterium]